MSSFLYKKKKWISCLYFLIIIIFNPPLHQSVYIMNAKGVAYRVNPHIRQHVWDFIDTYMATRLLGQTLI